MSTAKKILVVGERHSGKLRFIEALSGSLPRDISSTSHGGVTHTWSLVNKYYSAEIGIWVDEVTVVEEEDGDGWVQFSDSYLSEEAADVRASIGVLVVTFDRSRTEESAVSHLLECMKCVGDVCLADTLLLAVGTSTQSGAIESEENGGSWEDVCLDEGFEYIELGATGHNTFGEATGIARAKESIQACDWSDTLVDPSEDELLADLMAEDEALNKRLLETDLSDRETTIDESSIEDLEAMMQRILTARGKNVHSFPQPFRDC